MPPPWRLHNFTADAIQMIFEDGTGQDVGAHDEIVINLPIARIRRAGDDYARHGGWPNFAHDLLTVLKGNNDTYTVRENEGVPVVYVNLKRVTES